MGKVNRLASAKQTTIPFSYTCICHLTLNVVHVLSNRLSLLLVGTLPSAPTLLRVEDIQTRSLTFSFYKPNKNGDRVLFDFYWKTNRITFQGMRPGGLRAIYEYIEVDALFLHIFVVS